MIDPSILLQSNPVNIETPLQAQTQAQNLTNMASQAALQRADLTGVNLENQQKQMAIQQTQALNRAYMDSLTTGPDGSPDIDTGKLSKALSAAGQGSAIPQVLQGVTAYKKAANDLIDQNGKIAAAQADFGGTIGATVKGAGNDPHLFLTMAQDAIHKKAVDPQMAQPYVDAVINSFQQDPSGASAKQLVGQIAEHLIAGSPAQQKLINERMQAQGSQDRGTAAVGELNIKQQLLPGQLQGQALTNQKTQQEVTGTQPVTQYQKDELANRNQQLAVDRQNASTNRSRLSVEQYNAGLDANGNPVSYTDAQGNPVNISPIAKTIAEYKLPPVNARSYGSNRALMNQVLAVNPNFDIGQYEQRYKTMKDLAPSGPLGQQALALNTLVRHSDDMLDAAQALNNGNIQGFNALAQNIAQWTGKPAPTNFDQLKQYVAGETVKLVRGGGGSEADVQAAKANINRANSPAQLEGALRTNFAVAGGKLEALNSAVRISSGNTNYTALDPGAAQIMQKRGYDPNTLKPVPKPAPQQTTTTASPVHAPAGSVSVTDPRGNTYWFPNQAAADAYKRAARIP